MSYPESKFIDNIDFTKLKYLTDKIVDSISKAEFNILTGKPLTNIGSTKNVDSFFIETVASNLTENVNVNDNLIYKYPKLLELTTLRDMQVTKESTISAIFITEGATMKNMFGYYMYTVDEDGTKKILANETDSGKYYYDPTVIFPHVHSIDNDDNTLQRGDCRKLKGNLPNGNFENIYIGLFLIPHGWFAFQNNSLIDNNSIFYSTLEFNRTYVKSEFGMVNDKIYSIYFKATSENGYELLLSCFEDIFIDGTYDLDYNDCVVGFEISDAANIVDYDKYCKVAITKNDTPIRNNIIHIDNDGEHVEFDKNVYNITDDNDLIFERHRYFDNENDMKEMFDVYQKLKKNYKFNIVTDDSFGKYNVIFQYLFRKNDLKNGIDDNGNIKIYLYESKYDLDDKDILARYKALTHACLSNLNYYERYRLYDKHSENEIIRIDDILDNPSKKNIDGFRIIGNGTIDCVNGKSRLPFDESQIYRAYGNCSKDSKIIVNIKMDDHPTNYMNGKKKFARYVSFNVNDEHLIIDLGTLDLYDEIDTELVLKKDATFNNIKVSETIDSPNKIKDMTDIFSNNSGARYKIVTINNSMKFYCIGLSNIKDNPTMVYLDTESSLEWNDKYNELSGTHFDKQKIYKIDNFRS